MNVPAPAREQEVALLREQKNLLELVAWRRPLAECLEAITTSVTRLEPATRACIMVVSHGWGWSAYSATLPHGFREACREAGEIFRGLAVSCPNVGSNERWPHAWRRACDTFGISGCYCEPIVGADGQPVASLLLCFDAPQETTDWERKLASLGTTLASVAIAQQRATDRLQERTAAELHASEQRFHQLVDAVNDYAIFMLDGAGYVATWNPGVQTIKGYAPDEIVGKHFSVFYTPDDRAAGRPEKILETVRREGRFEEEGWRVRKDGTHFWANVLISALRDPNGHVTGYAKVTRDLTAKRAAEEMAQATRKKDEFLAMLGHELRNPLAPIMTATSLIRVRGKATVRELDVLDRQTRHLARLVDDLLDISRITAGKLSLERSHLELSEIVAQAIESTAPMMSERRIQLFANVAPSSLVVNGDRDRLVQVLTNVLVNAAKFTPTGKGITVSVSANDGEAVIAIRDEGRGISADLLPQVFDIFTQGQQSSDRRIGGLGLGLSIARSIVLAHGGAIAIASPGQELGTTVRIRLPLVLAPAKTTMNGDGPPRPTGAPESMRVLVVDDNADSAEMLAAFVQEMGYATFVAADPQTAISMAREHAPHAAIVDIGLPEMDGYELARALRIELGDERVPKLIALTGYASERDRQRALAAGFAEHMAKPVDMAQLTKTLRRLVGEPETLQAGSV